MGMRRQAGIEAEQRDEVLFRSSPYCRAVRATSRPVRRSNQCGQIAALLPGRRTNPVCERELYLTTVDSSGFTKE